MADLTCVVCGEPWDAWGVRHGDMLRWEASLFLKGAGCPACTGKSPFPKNGPLEDLAGLQHPEEAFLRDRILINPDEDGSHELLARVDRDGSNDSRPAWEYPAVEPLWSCACCNVQVASDPESDYPDGKVDGVVGGDLQWIGGDAVHYWMGFAYAYGAGPGHDSPESESHATIDEAEYCPGCVELCSSCQQVWLFTQSDMTSDPHDTGASLPTSDGRSVCITCFHEIEAEGEE